MNACGRLWICTQAYHNLLVQDQRERNFFVRFVDLFRIAYRVMSHFGPSHLGSAI
jgi:hypothetical protein